MKIFVREGADRRMVERFYVAVVQVVLLFGYETYVLTPRLEKYLDGFHHREVWRMVSMGPKRKWDGTWVYTPIGEALEMVGMEEIGAYIYRYQIMVTQYIETCPIMDLYLEAERNPGLRLSRKWREHPALDILGIRAGHTEAERGGRRRGRNNLRYM